VTHFRLANAIILPIFALQCAVLLWLTFSPELALIDFLVGAVVASSCVPTLFQRVVTTESSMTLSGFSVGGCEATAQASDLVPIRFHLVHFAARTWPSVAVFEFHAQTSPNYYLIPRFGWSNNRELFRVIADMAAQSPLSLNPRTQRALTTAAMM
jgi:hypothetical protein